AAARGGLARRWPVGDADPGAAARRAAEHRHRHPHRPRLRLARADRRRNDRDQRRPGLHAVPGARLLPHRSDRLRDGRDRRAVAADRPAAARAARARDDRALGHGARGMRLFLIAWSCYVRSPALRSFAPFIPLILLWAIVAESGMFPRAFFPGPAEVVNSFGSLVYKGILPEYLDDSVVRLARVASAARPCGLPLGGPVGLCARALARP